MVPVRCSVASRASRIVLTLLLVPGILGLTAGRAVAVACSVRNLNTWVFYTDLQVAISAAAPGAALRVSGTCVGNFSVAQDLNLFGRSGATLDGNGTGTTLKVSAGDVKVFGLTITGGTGWDACAPAGCFIAGGIYNLGTLTLVRSAVSGNSVTNVGGGIFNDVGGTLTIAGSTVSENSAPFGGGGINNLGTLVLWRSVVDGNSAQGGGGILNNGTLTISRSSVRDNVATDYFGGGIINNGMITINRSTLSGNSSPSAGGYGGAITNQEGTITITDSKVTGNSASALGGGIQNQTGGTIHLNHSTLTANSASFGGGIFEGGGTLQITASKVSGNSAGNGGGVYKTGAGITTVVRSVLEENSAINSGGGIYQAGGGGTLTITESLVHQNSAVMGAGIFNSGGDVVFAGSSVTENSSSGAGGGMFNAGGTTAITRSAFSQNSASTGGGILNTGGSVSLTRSTVTDNSARFGGGGIATEDGALTVRSSTLSGNTAADPNGGGGGIFNSIFEAASSTVDIANSTMSQNSGAFGGAIINVGTLTVSRSTLTENSASSGGGIYNGNSDPVVGSATLAASINAANAGGNCSGTGTATSHGYNLTGPDCGFASTGDQTVADNTAAIGIGPLADNGGPTQTMALLSTSPAVDAIPTGAVAVDGTTPLCPVFGTVDQRGAFRPRGTGCDIGAFERQAETTRTVIDFTTSPGGVFDPNFYELDGIVFPSQRCGSAGCAPWFIGFVQGDQALIQSPVFGPVTATFTSPISGLSLQIAPASQGTAIYTLTALSGSGEVLGTMSRTITQDSGDPEDGPPGYFTMTLESLQTPAASFILDSEFVRSSFGNNAIEYGVSSITFAR